MTRIDALIRAHAEQADRIMAGLEAAAPWLNEETWLRLMASLLETAHGPAPEPKPKAAVSDYVATVIARTRAQQRPVLSADDLLFGLAWAELYGKPEPETDDFTPEQRRQMTKSGVAMDDGQYPIPDVNYLKKAIRAYGRANPADRAKVRAHIMRRARALGQAALIPKGWLDKAAAVLATLALKGRWAAWAEALGAPSSGPDEEFGETEMQEMVENGVALPDGTHPIPDSGHLSREIRDFPTVPAADQPTVKMHIIRRADDLGENDKLPVGWQQSGDDGDDDDMGMSTGR